MKVEKMMKVVIIILFLVSFLGAMMTYVVIISCASDVMIEPGNYNIMIGNDNCSINNYDLMVGGALGLLVVFVGIIYMNYQIALIKNKRKERDKI